MIKEKIEAVLTEKFGPRNLEVHNESYKHAGHNNFNGEGETHFKVIISGDSLTGKNRLEKHRAVISALGDIMTEIHSLELVIS